MKRSASDDLRVSSTDCCARGNHNSKQQELSRFMSFGFAKQICNLEILEIFVVAICLIEEVLCCCFCNSLISVDSLERVVFSFMHLSLTNVN